MSKIDEVAKLARVSKGTVSNVFSQKRPTSKEVTERVLRASRELNYVPNQIARSLVTKRTMAIGLTIPHGRFFFSAFHTQFINSVVLEAARYGYRVLLDMIPAQDIATPFLASYPIDGAVVMDPREADDRIELMQREGIPFVTIGRVQATAPTPTVDNDNRKIVRDICDYLFALGHGRIAFLNAGVSTTVAADRRESFLEAMAGRGVRIEPWMMFHKPELSDERYSNYGYEETKRVIEDSGGRATALIADDDRTAFGCLHALKELGLDVPNDISVFVICGDDSMLTRSTPALTSMDLRPADLGARAVTTLLRMLGIVDGDVDERCIVDSGIVERSSCAAAPNQGRNRVER
ncbi:LacI family transcriptional regulator [Paenibacillus antri]|uniref:LacI family transcriptional regulator n=1 Tax=Paenibacillus antri TaxID=2582848 RepID=A0A5R9GBF7_9BACL|nr:LacI family DNA-binding transcriptional regulator [Paenibacillus antri]TLS50698.1 LacI family transcriptional regulator [Paenibacillus antri]